MFSRAAVVLSSRAVESVSSTSSSLRWLSSGGKKGFRARRRSDQSYRSSRIAGANSFKSKPKVKGPKEPFDISKRAPKIDLSNIKINKTEPEIEDDEYDATFGGAVFHHPQLDIALQMAKRDDLDIETQLKMIDYFTSPEGSTEDLVGERRIMALEALEEQDRDTLMREITQMVEKQSVDYLELPKSDIYTKEDLENAQTVGTTRVPANQLAHGDWGEQLIRTDRVCKMWRGGRIDSFRALVIGGNLRGCGGFGIGKAFEAEDAVEIACRMARRNIFFVDRYRNRGITRDLVGRQNSCKVFLRSTDNGIRGNPICVEILKLFGITNVVAKAHGNRNQYNVVRATYKALLTHESLEDISAKRGLRLINLQKARHLQL